MTAKKRHQSKTLAVVGMITSGVFVLFTGLIIGLLVLTTFTGIQQKARNTERETDIKALYGQLEAYYVAHGKYPTFGDVNDASWRSTNMIGLDKEALRDPQGTDATLVASPAAHAYSYEVVADDGGSCDNVQHDCTSYTLTATEEGGAGTFTRSSLNGSSGSFLNVNDSSNSGSSGSGNYLNQ